MPGREDYILRHLALLRQFLAQVLKHRKDGQVDQAMAVLLQAQEKLFGRPLAEVARFDLSGQLALLALQSSPQEARERQFAYALWLDEAGRCYAARDRDDLALGANKAALFVVLNLMTRKDARDAEMEELARDLLARIPPEQIDAPLRELLAAVRTD